MTTPRDRVKQAVIFKETDLVPFQLDCTVPVRERLAEHLGTDDLEGALGNHLAYIRPLPPGSLAEIGTGLFQDEWKVVWDRTVDQDIGVPAPPLKGATCDGYEFPDPFRVDRYADFSRFALVNEDRFRLMKISHVLFERAWFLRGFSNFLEDLLLNPGFAEELLDRIMQFHLDILDHVADHCLDGVFFADDYGQQKGLIIGPHLWRKFIKPRLMKLCTRAKRYGWVVFLHSCGDIAELLPDFIELGVDVLNPMAPETMDVFEIKRKYGRDLAFFGGISVQRTLPLGTPAQVRREVRETRRVLAQDGGYILSPSHVLTKDVPLANILAFLETARGADDVCRGSR